MRAHYMIDPAGLVSAGQPDLLEPLPAVAARKQVAQWRIAEIIEAFGIYLDQLAIEFDRRLLPAAWSECLAGSTLFCFPRLLAAQHPLAVIVNETMPVRVAGMIQYYQVILSRRWPQAAADLLHIQGEALRRPQQNGGADRGNVEALADDFT
ncbi:MAG: hypothetical protein JO212_04685 [Acetobacteraceae bacterium]|nr:hypothetical protein [Acetobacteraceae bacterium]